MGYSTLEVCSSGGAFEAVPHPRQSLDLPMIRRSFERAGVEVIDARVMLIVRTIPEATISRDGRIVLKTRDRAAAERMFERILGMAGVRRESPPDMTHG
jgi:hypothetical protein